MERGRVASPQVDIMNASIVFHVAGLPVPQGSMRAFLVNGKPILTSSAKGLAAWRTSVRLGAQDHAARAILAGPVGVSIVFRLPCPKSLHRKTRPDPRWVQTRPDIDKLARGVLDAITHILIADDAQVALLVARKEYGAAGIDIRVWPLDERRTRGERRASG